MSGEHQTEEPTFSTVDIVLTVYNASHAIESLSLKLRSLSRQLSKKYNLNTNLIFVDDASLDETTKNIKKFFLRSKEFSAVTLLELSRNFGQHIAILAGLKESAAQHVLLMDGDLDQDPLFSLNLFEEYFNNNRDFDVVYAYRKKRGGRKAKQLASILFWKMLQSGLRSKLELGQMSMRVMKRDYVEEILRYSGSRVFWGAVFQLSGYQQKGIEFPSPVQGKSNYRLRKRVRVAIETLLDYSSFPYKIALFLLCTPLVIVTTYAITLLPKSEFLQNQNPGWLTIMFLLCYLIFIQCLIFLFLIFFFWSNRSGVSSAPQYHIRKRRFIKLN